MVEGKIEGVVERCQAAPLRPAWQCGFVSDPYLRVSYVSLLRDGFELGSNLTEMTNYITTWNIA
jgi:hypothetical protein